MQIKKDILILYIIAATASAIASNFWNVMPEKPVSYLYAHGLSGSEIAMGRYCPEFIASTGEKIMVSCGGHVIGYPHSAVNFPELLLTKPIGFTLNPFTLLANGIRNALYPISKHYYHKNYGLTIIENPDSLLTIANYVPRFCANVAQEGDINALAQQYKKHQEQFPDTDIIFYGDSRGAATMFNFIALHQPTEVKAAVLEGIFDSIDHVIKHIYYLNKSVRFEKLLHKLFALSATKYKRNGISPRECAEIMGDTIPLLFVTSLKDESVASQCTLYLYKRLKSRGHTNIHLLVLKNSAHTIYIIDDPNDQQLYETTVHAFYKYYGLPHNADKAALGQQSFLASQPTVEELTTQYPLPQCALCSYHEGSHA